MGDRHLAGLHTELPMAAGVVDDAHDVEYRLLVADVHQRFSQEEVDFEQASCMLFSVVQWHAGGGVQPAARTPKDQARSRFVEELTAACWV
jgi:hypothetical protein